jgi:hypothetical protein
MASPRQTFPSDGGSGNKRVRRLDQQRRSGAQQSRGPASTPAHVVLPKILGADCQYRTLRLRRDAVSDVAGAVRGYRLGLTDAQDDEVSSALLR